MQTWYTTIPCLGAAFFGVHPSMFYTHYSINLTWQFWIHTESIRHMGWFMEFFFNTPSHHRVHHGRNPFCIDKNYAGVLIIWDRMFGTFQSEFATEEKVQYGLVQNIRSFDPTFIQFGYLNYVLTKAYNTNGIKNKLNVLIMGPGYDPGQPEFRLGDPKKLPEIDSKYKIFNPEISNTMKIYAFFAGVHANLLFEAAQMWKDVVLADKLIVIGYFIYSGSAAARLFKGCNTGNILELIRYWILIPFLLSRNFFGATIMNFYRDYLMMASILQLLISSFFLKRYFNNKVKQA